MNQAHPKPKFDNPVPSLTLTKSDAKLLHNVLLSGEHSLARQQDVIELNKRIISMFKTLNLGLEEQQNNKAAQDRKVLIEKLDKMELAVNGMEGMLRIELASQLESVLESAFDRRIPKQRPRRSLLGISLLSAVAGLILGVLYSDVLGRFYSQASAQLIVLYSSFF